MDGRFLFVLTLLLLSSSACANSCSGGEEKRPDTTRSASTSAEGGVINDGKPSRFAKPFVPGAATALPPRGDE